tara:strand:+ start:2150 stop:2542 length:393 start_codon:yes stop_codon:yes gene_type:complete
MGKYSRDKGARFEREIANRLKEVFGPRTTRSSGQCFSGDLRADVDCPEIWVECKVGKRPNIKAALEQAEEAEAGAKTGKSPVAICKWDRQEPIASMRLDFFIELIKIAYRGESDDGGNTLVQTTDDSKRA